MMILSHKFGVGVYVAINFRVWFRVCVYQALTAFTFINEYCSQIILCFPF